MIQCTWVGCEAEATKPQTSEDGSRWANLCDEHDRQLNNSITKFDAKKMLGNWVKAQGGAKAAAARMTGGSNAAT